MVSKLTKVSLLSLFCRWALVKDPEVAKRMTKFVELNTIGVSKDSQLRAAKVLEAVADSCVEGLGEDFFASSYRLMAERWQQLREAVKISSRFSLPEFSPAFCHFQARDSMPQPGKFTTIIITQ